MGRSRAAITTRGEGCGSLAGGPGPLERQGYRLLQGQNASLGKALCRPILP